MRNRSVALVTALIILAGCTGASGGPTETSVSPSETEPDVQTDTPSPTPSPEPTPPPTPDSLSPFENEYVLIGVHDYQNPHDQPVEHYVREAVDYWQANGSQYKAYPADLYVAPDAAEPDIVVRFVDHIHSCNYEVNELTVGCAEVLKPGDTARTPVVVRIETGYTGNATTEIVKHELGHVLGLDHGDEPTDVMRASGIVPRLPQDDAVDRTRPWQTTNLTYAVDYGERPEYEHHDINQELQNAFGYIASGADGYTPASYTFTRTNNRSEADILIRFPDDLTCADAEGSCDRVFGVSRDEDAAREYYTNSTIEVSESLDVGAVDWHVAYWLALQTNSFQGTELPPPLQDADYSDRRGNWWR